MTGTDTGVGKTLVACALVRALRGRGLDVGVMKPVETGVPPEGPSDARALRAAAAVQDPLAEICPVQLALPAAPNVAAAHAGRSIELPGILEAFGRLAGRHATLVVEGAGGLLVPITDALGMADLAGRLGLPLVVVARAALGTINHTRLTLEAAHARRLPVAGVVVSHSDGALSAADSTNLAALRASLGPLLVGEIPPLPGGAEPDPAMLDLDALLAGRRI